MRSRRSPSTDQASCLASHGPCETNDTAFYRSCGCWTAVAAIVAPSSCYARLVRLSLSQENAHARSRLPVGPGPADRRGRARALARRHRREHAGFAIGFVLGCVLAALVGWIM